MVEEQKLAKLFTVQRSGDQLRRITKYCLHTKHMHLLGASDNMFSYLPYTNIESLTAQGLLLHKITRSIDTMRYHLYSL